MATQAAEWRNATRRHRSGCVTLIIRYPLQRDIFNREAPENSLVFLLISGFRPDNEFGSRTSGFRPDNEFGSDVKTQSLTAIRSFLYFNFSPKLCKPKLPKLLHNVDMILLGL